MTMYLLPKIVKAFSITIFLYESSLEWLFKLHISISNLIETIHFFLNQGSQKSLGFYSYSWIFTESYFPVPKSILFFQDYPSKVPQTGYPKYKLIVSWFCSQKSYMLICLDCSENEPVPYISHSFWWLSRNLWFPLVCRTHPNIYLFLGFCCEYVSIHIPLFIRTLMMLDQDLPEFNFNWIKLFYQTKMWSHL